MKEFLATVTSKGQVTVPVEVRRLLGLKPQDKVAFLVQEHQGEVKVQVLRAGSIVARTAGAFKREGPPPTAEELRVEAEIAWAEDVMGRPGIQRSAR
jgi:AbrB family looped-hinge helix DNA binding protein